MAAESLYLTDPQADIVESTYSQNLFLGAQGIGKTHTLAIVAGNFITNPVTWHLNGIIAANTYSQLTQSTLKGVRKVWRETFDLQQYDPKTGKGDYVVGQKPAAGFVTEGHDIDDYRSTICFRWGTVIFTRSLDNYMAIDGMEVGWACLDETKDTKEEAVMEVIMGRLRQNRAGVNPLYIFTSPAKVPWINEWFGLDDYVDEIKSTIYNPPLYFKKVVKNKLVTISSVFLNQHNLPQSYIDDRKEVLTQKRQNMLIYGDPISSSGGELLDCFTRQVHVGKFAHKYDAQEVLHCSFDQNLRPYITCTIYQIFRNGKYIDVYCLDEVCLKAPDNKSSAQCKQILNKYYRGKQHRGGVYIYGDPSGKKDDTRDGEDDYRIIEEHLKLMRPKLKLPKAHPGVAISAQFVNKILEESGKEGLFGIRFFVDEGCRHTIADMTYLKEAADGGKHKEYGNDDDGVRYEKWGHCVDTIRYFFTEAFWREFDKFSGTGSGLSGAQTTNNTDDKGF